MKTGVQTKRLEELTAIAKRGLEDAARAVFEIHEDKLYLEKYDTFEEWLQQELGLQRRRGYDLLESHVGYKKIEQHAPQNVQHAAHRVSARAAQEVASIPDQHVAKVMDAATEGGTKPATAAAVKRVAAEIVPTKVPEEVGEVGREWRANRKLVDGFRVAINDLIRKITAVSLEPGLEQIVKFRSSIIRALETAKGNIVGCIPGHICPYCQGNDAECEGCQGRGWLSKTEYQQAPEDLRREVERLSIGGDR